MRNRSASEIRIIGGLWKRTPIRVPDVLGLRPTPDRVRETVFNWIGAEIEGATCLDLFAGTGALGFEAASRGAANVVLVESAKIAQQGHAALKQKLNANQIDLIAGDARHFLERCERLQSRFDFIFLDPPFHQTWAEKLLVQLASLLNPQGMLYLEAEFELDPEQMTEQGTQAWASAWKIHKAGKAGQVHYHLLKLLEITEN